MTQPAAKPQTNAPTGWAALVLYLARGIPREGRKAYHARAALRSMRRGTV